LMREKKSFKLNQNLVGPSIISHFLQHPWLTIQSHLGNGLNKLAFGWTIKAKSEWNDPATADDFDDWKLLHLDWQFCGKRIKHKHGLRILRPLDGEMFSLVPADYEM
jgi:hypothetical protein